MLANCFKSSDEVQQSALTFWSADPFGNFKKNWTFIMSKEFKPAVGFMNSFIVATCSTLLNVYFSSLTAYAISAYEWNDKNWLKYRKKTFKEPYNVPWSLFPARYCSHPDAR